MGSTRVVPYPSARASTLARSRVGSDVIALHPLQQPGLPRPPDFTRNAVLANIRPGWTR